MEHTIYLETQEETIYFGKKIGSKLIKPSLVLIEGDLGVGKTTLTKGIGLGLGIKKTINSPTFTLLKVYDDLLYHMDLYRSTKHDFDLEEYIDDNICVIEWPNYNILPNEYLKIIMTRNKEVRKLEITSIGGKYDKLLKEIICEA